MLLCLVGTPLTWKERLFCMIAYLPKPLYRQQLVLLPLAAGLACGKIVLSVAVMAIVTAAPVGAFGMDVLYKKLLNRDLTD